MHEDHKFSFCNSKLWWPFRNARLFEVFVKNSRFSGGQNNVEAYLGGSDPPTRRCVYKWRTLFSNKVNEGNKLGRRWVCSSSFCSNEKFLFHLWKDFHVTSKEKETTVTEKKDITFIFAQPAHNWGGSSLYPVQCSRMHLLRILKSEKDKKVCWAKKVLPLGYYSSHGTNLLVKSTDTTIQVYQRIVIWRFGCILQPCTCWHCQDFVTS